MPELPEVQTIVDELKKKIIGKKITDVWVDPVKPVKTGHGASWPKIKKEIINKKILNIRRRAKYIIMDIEGKKTLFVHQKISGHLLYGKWARKSQIANRKSQIDSNQEWISIIPGPLRDDSRNGYIRLIFFLSNGYQLGLSDLRRFAKVILVDDDKVNELEEIRRLGPEPLEINFNQFLNLFKKKRGKIKPILMDPTFIAGIGNIYSDEILWDAGYHPISRVENLKEKDIKNIFSSMVKILKKAIKYQGDSIDDYRLPSGEKGRYQEVQKAYHQTKKLCSKKDGGTIARLKVGGRSAHFCPKHQKLV